MLKITKLKLSFLPFVILVLAISNVPGQIATGGNYTLDQAALANGGGSSAGGNYTVSGTTGQGAAGANPMGGNYSLRNGFWGPGLAPTAASAVVSGRVIGQNGQGLPNVGVFLAGGPLTAPRAAVTSSLGYFMFEDIETGQNYVISVVSNRYGFGQATQNVWVIDNVSDVLFVSTWEN